MWLALKFGFGPDALSGSSENASANSALLAVLKALNLTVRSGLFVAPVVVPIILYAEWKGIDRPLYFAGAGIILGLAVWGLLFYGIGLTQAPLLAFIVVTTPLTAAMTFWTIAWQWLAPRRWIETV